ncbi:MULTISPECIES: DUF3551 domain-containing protein [Bradyrhizobium]|uniref:DUF3551 domain-containing protein n=1 Tax=Bradyrhizobium tropiciagri TaxID=312253 RepID=UPI001009B11C|nr:DUF3551 domain-containing protein [Bradyrhizobium tropiciagri]
MRFLPFIVVVTFSVLVGLASGATAAARNRAKHIAPPPPDLYCLQGRSWGYPGNCQFSTYRQCQATASGTYAHCAINPTYAFEHGWRPR